MIFFYIFCTSLFLINHLICKTHKDPHVGPINPIVNLQQKYMRDLQKIYM